MVTLTAGPRSSPSSTPPTPMSIVTTGELAVAAVGAAVGAADGGAHPTQQLHPLQSQPSSWSAWQSSPASAASSQVQGMLSLSGIGSWTTLQMLVGAGDSVGDAVGSGVVGDAVGIEVVGDSLQF